MRKSYHFMRDGGSLLLVLLLCAAMSAFLTSSANCAPAYLYEWGHDGRTDSLFASARGIVVQDGLAFVADPAVLAIKVFTDTGRFLAAWNPVGPGSNFHPLFLAIATRSQILALDPLGSSLAAFLESGTLVAGAGCLSSTQPNAIPFCGCTGGSGVAASSDGRVYVSDNCADRILVLEYDGINFSYLEQWGTPRTGIHKPERIAVGRDGTLFVVDSAENKVFRISNDGTPLGSWGGAGSAPGLFNNPTGIAVDGAGQVLVVDQFNDRVQIFTSNGALVDAFGSPGSGPGQFATPDDIAVAPDGRLFVSDTGNSRIQVFAWGPTPSTQTTWGRLKLRYR